MNLQKIIYLKKFKENINSKCDINKKNYEIRLLSLLFLFKSPMYLDT